MRILRGYKSVVFRLILTTFVSLGTVGCEELWENICKYFSKNSYDVNNENKDINKKEYGNNNKNIINITNEDVDNMKNSKKNNENNEKYSIDAKKNRRTWTIFKITITTEGKDINVQQLNIGNILDARYTTNGNINLEEQNSFIDDKNNLSEKIWKKDLNAFIVTDKNVNKAVKMMKKSTNNEINTNNTNNEKNEENVINNENSKENDNINGKKGNIININENIINENNNNTYYVLVKDITPRINKEDKENEKIKTPLFSALNNNSKNKKKKFTLFYRDNCCRHSRY